MPEVVDILIDAENSGAVKGLNDVDEALLKAGSAAEMAEKGVNPLAARMDALSKANGDAAGSAQELSVSWRKQAEAAEAAGGKVAGLNSKLASLKSAKQHASGLTSELNQVASAALKAGVAILAIASALAVTAISGGIGAASERLAVEAGLKALMGDAQVAEQHLKDLKVAAGLPGVNLDGAIKMSVGLQGAAVDADYATRAVKALGNELALMGKGDQEFDQAQRALSQIAGAAKLSGEELNQLRDSGLPVGQILRDAFGTVDIEAIQKLGLTGKEAFERIIEAMEKAPKAAGGVKNAIENLKIGIGEIQIAFGKGLLSGKAEDDGAKLAANLEKLEKTAYDLGTALVPVLEGLAGMAVGLTENDGAAIKAFGTMTVLVGGVLLVGGAIGKTIIFIKDMKLALEALGIAQAASQAGWVAVLGPIALVAVAVAGLAYELYRLNVRYNELKAATDAATESQDRYNNSVNDLQSRGYVDAEGAAAMKEPDAPTRFRDVITPWKTQREREWEEWQNRPSQVGKAAPGKSIREQEADRMKREAAEAQVKGGAPAAASRAPMPAGAEGGRNIVPMPAQRPTADGYGWVARPELSQNKRELREALAERDRQQQAMTLDAIRGRR